MPPYKRKAPASPVSVPSPRPTKKHAMASDASDEDIFDYDDEEGSDIDYDDGDSSIDDGIAVGKGVLTCRHRYGPGFRAVARPGREECS